MNRSKRRSFHKPIARSPASERTLDGVVFDSKAELKRFAQLRLLERTGHIRNLQRQVPYRFEHNGVALRNVWKADFEYEEFADSAWRKVTEDCKGFDRPISAAVRKLMKSFHGIDVKVVMV